DELLRSRVAAAVLGQGDAGIAVDRVIRFDRHDVGEFGVGDLPDVPDQPCIDVAAAGPGVARDRAVGSIAGDVRADLAHCIEIAFPTRHVLPNAILASPVDDQ
nr:hypothetical protein [Tanacetum cinerariifolium]